MSVVGDVLAEVVERVLDAALVRRFPRWLRWLAVAAFFCLVIALPEAPAWQPALSRVVWTSLVFTTTIGLVLEAYARKLGGEGAGSLGTLVFSFALFTVCVAVLPSLVEGGSAWVPPSPGLWLALGLSLAGGLWEWAQRVWGGRAREPFSAWSWRASASGLAFRASRGG